MNCIITLRNIGSLDNVLPLIYEFKKSGIIHGSLFVAKDKRHYEIMKTNVVLYKGLCDVGGKLCYLFGGKVKLLRYLGNCFRLRTFFYKKTVTIETYEETTVRLLASLNKIMFGGKRAKLLIWSLPLKQAKNSVSGVRSIKGELEAKEQIINGFDAIILNHSQKEYEEIANVKLKTCSKMLKVGYTRGLKEWNTYLDDNFDKFFPREIHGPYCFYPLSFFHADKGRFPIESDNIPSAEILRESLMVLKQYNDRLLTVFKPHHKTDLIKFHELLDSINYKNFIISYIHPLILIKKARFTISYHPTSLLVESYYHGIPSVEYAHYDSRIFKFTGGQSRLLECVDYFIHRDKEQLREVLKKLIYEEVIQVKRDLVKLKKDFPILSNQEIKEEFSEIM